MASRSRSSAWSPAGFQIFYPADLWTLYVPKRSPEQRRMHYLQVLGRLKPGVSLAQAQAAMNGIAAGIARIAPETNKNWGIAHPAPARAPWSATNCAAPRWCWAGSSPSFS